MAIIFVNNILLFVPLTDVHIDTVSETASETHSDAPSETSSGATSATLTFHLPPHLLGRTVDNPSSDIPPGRRTQKPRLGVRVPYRNLTSQIVTQNEIAQEIFERTAKKHPELLGVLPEGMIKRFPMFYYSSG